MLRQIVVDGGEVMVELVTSASGHLHQGFRLNVSHRRRRTKATSRSLVTPCRNVIDVSSRRQGLITSPHHWFPADTDCSWSLVTNNDTSERIWLEIHWPRPKRTVNTCAHRLQIQQPSGDLQLLCEGNETRSHVTLVPGQRVDLRFTSQLGSLNGLTEFQFNIFYMLVRQEVTVEGSICDRSVSERHGRLELVSDRLLLKRKSLRCTYRITAPQHHRIELVVKELTFDPIRQCDDVSSRPERSYDSLSVHDGQLVRCFCRSTTNQSRLVSSSNELVLVLDLMHIFDEAYKDAELYRFDVEYSVSVNECTAPVAGTHSGSIDWRTHQTPPRACSWYIVLPENARILFKINSDIGENCNSNGLTLRYYERNVTSERRHERKLCTPNGEYVSPFPLRSVHVQLMSDRAESVFHLQWNVLDDAVSSYACPNSSWGLPTALRCDGQINCPQTELYGYLLDEEMCGESRSSGYLHQLQSDVLLFVLALTVSLVVVLALVFVYFRRRIKRHSVDS